MSLCTDTHTYIYQCMDYGCAANAALSTRSPCTFSADWRCLVPLLTESQFASIQPTNLIEFNIFDIFDFAKKKYDIMQQALTQNHVISPHLQDNIVLDLLESSISRNDLGELLAVLLALSVVLQNSKVRINTDSLNVITQFEKLKKSRFYLTSRKYFKANNNFLWAILCRIILTLNLHVEMFKVIAHGDDMGNNYVDNLAKQAHFDQDRYIVFRRDVNMMKVLPCWNGIIIENKLRLFLKNICNYKGLEKFINLNRNSKYRQLEVDWTSTFSCLSCDINDNETSVSSSKTKAQKVHLLIEEILTIEQMKKSLLDLYDGWMCPICGLHDETFNHIWTCSGHYDIINNIRDKTINHLLTWILEYNDNIQDFNNLIALNIWDISYDPDDFTFIDLIKGVISMSLSELLNSWTTKKNVVDVLVQMRQFIFNEIFENVWILRRMFKNKLKFARSAPNAILYNPYIYGYRDFYDNQLQAKITDFCIQLNDNGLLGKITEIRLKSLQAQLWISRPLLEKLPYNYNNIFPTIKGGRIPLEDVVDNAYYSRHKERLHEKNILFLDQIVSGDKSRLLLWKEILIKAYVPISSQRKEAKWYTDIRFLITLDNIHLNSSITQLFGVSIDNVDEARSYDIDKKNRSLIAFYNPHFNSVVIGKIQGIDNTQRLVIKHFYVNMSQCTDTHTYIYQCMDFRCAANAALSTRSYLLDSSTSRNDLLRIQRTLAPFDNNDYYIFEFYTDGSLIELGTEQCSISCAFAQISDLFDIPHVKFYSTIDKWPSAYRGELLAVLLALSVVPRNSKIRINTDSLNVITQFEKLKKSRFSQTSQEYFKANNNFLWAILCRIILTLNLHVEMFKVIAYGDDMVLPCWNGILIETKLRLFLKNICNYKGLEKFLNLNRNSKYRQIEVDWTSTFICLNCDINNNETSVSSSKTKAQKMKKSLLDLYDGWMCPICGLHDETFNHVWTCSGHYDIINNIRDKTINHLLTWILEYNDNIQDFNNLLALDIWDISYDPDVFTFIDLIKGIIPMSLSELLNSWTTKKNVVDVLIQMRQFIFNEIFENVWIPRCLHLKEFERSLGLTKKKKLEFKSVRSLPNNNS
ncbi:hypothetical protein RhiirA4_466568, partial [Rhizophagus irregularis]